MKENYFDLLERALAQIKAINGPDEKCVHSDISKCRNHQLIHDIEDYLNEAGEVLCKVKK